jgi:hypothetical protein
MTAPRDYAAAAAELGVSVDWLKEMTPKLRLPHMKFSVSPDGKPSTKGRGPVRFTDDHLEQIRRMFEVNATAAPSGPVSRRRAS